MKRIGFLAIGFLMLVGCSGKEQIAPEQQENVVQCPTHTPLPTLPQIIPNSTPTPTTAPSPTPTEALTVVSTVEKGSDDWYSVDYLQPENGYEKIIKITFTDSATSIYLGFKNGSWMIIIDEYG